jgi:hypothetical protein
MECDDSSRPPLLKPSGQLNEIKNPKPAAAAGAQSGNAPESFRIVVKRGAEKNPYADE